MLLLVLYYFSSLAYSLSCTAQHECQSVTTNYNYARCVSGQCQCKTDLGFTGSATVTDKCSCLSPNDVYWAGAPSLPYCITYQDAVTYKLEKASNDYQRDLIGQLYGSLVWPTPAIIMGSLIAGVPTSIGNHVASNGIGRVTPLGIFTGVEGIVEYFYGTVWTGAARIYNVTFEHLVSQGNTVAVSANLFFNIYNADQSAIVDSYILRQSGTFVINDAGLIQSMDLIIHNLGPNSNRITPHYDQTVLGTLCYLVMNLAHCNATYDPNGYYTDFNDCIAYHANPNFVWGTWDDIYFNGNSTICHYFHALLAVARPAVHCSHSGKTGGGKCVPHIYSSYFNSHYKRAALEDYNSYFEQEHLKRFGKKVGPRFGGDRPEIKFGFSSIGKRS